MKPLILLSLLALAAGCSEPKNETIACGGKGWGQPWNGFMVIQDHKMSNCVPCSFAVSPEARFVCFGVTYTAKP